MELKKGENMAEHQNEIFARPARTWFQTAHEKQKSKGSPKDIPCSLDLILIEIRT